jgi:hypothetical protein
MILVDGAVNNLLDRHVSANEPNAPVIRQGLRHRRARVPGARTTSASRVAARLNAWMGKLGTSETTAGLEDEARYVRPEGQKEVMANAVYQGTAVN